MTQRRFEFKVPPGFSTWSQSAKEDRFFILFLFPWVIPLLLSTIFILFRIGDLPNEIPLFYSRIWGVNQLALKQYIFLPVFGTVLLGIFDLGIAVNLHSQNRVQSYLLAGTASLVSILSLITIFNIIRLLS